MTKTEALPIKYIYLDVVGFTRDRSVEDQIEIIRVLNYIVKRCVSFVLPDADILYIPIGDGLCLCIMDIMNNYDDHLKIAEDIIRQIVNIHNPTSKANQRFEIRIGINENVDNVITDINGNRNVCGLGINDAQRIMSFADSNQILVGRITYDTLKSREKYLKSFRRFQGQTKHNINIEIYQYIGGNIFGVNTEIPSSFVQAHE